MSQQETPSHDLTALVRLPDDLLSRILGQLDLATQLKMMHVHSRFLTVMPRVWRSQHIQYADFRWTKFPGCDKDLRIFLETNQQTFKVLRLGSCCSQNNIITEYVFPNVHDLALGSVSMGKVIKSFPNLRTLCPDGDFTGQHFEEFAHLEHLSLMYCPNLEVKNLLCILESCKLKTLKLARFSQEEVQTIDLPFERIKDLEVLHCNEWELKWFTKPLKLTHLKELILDLFRKDLPTTDVFTACVQRLEEAVDDEMTTVLIVYKSAKKTMQPNLPHLPTDADRSFFSIQHNICDTYGIWFECQKQIRSVKVTNFSSVIAHIKMYPPLTEKYEGINQLCLQECSILMKTFIDHVLCSWKNLEILGLDNCKFSFGDFTFEAHKIAEGRRKTIHIYLKNNVHICVQDATREIKYFPMNWTIMGQDRLLEVHMEECPNID